MLRKIPEDECNNSVSEFIDKYMKVMYIALDANDNDNKSLYYSDFIITNINLIQFHSSPHLLFEIIRDMLNSIESNVCSAFWREMLNTITTSVHSIQVQQLLKDDPMRFDVYFH